MNMIVKVYNNNTVAARIDDGKECILTGAGIGFSKKHGDTVPTGRVEKIYYIQSELQTKFLKLLEHSTSESMEVAEAIVKKAEEQLNVQLGPLAAITLSDHLCFAIERQQKGINMPNLLADEVKLLYAEEYQIGLWGLTQIEQKTGIQLCSDEASYIAMHLVDAAVKDNKETITRTLQFVKDIVDIIRSDYKIQLTPGDENFLRLNTHLKYLGREICNRKAVHSEDPDDANDMLEYLLKKNPESRRCIAHITGYIQKEFLYELQKTEIIYLLIYINRII